MPDAEPSAAAPRVHCPACGKRFRVDPADLERRARTRPARCSRCGASFRIRETEGGRVEAYVPPKGGGRKARRSRVARGRPKVPGRGGEPSTLLPDNAVDEEDTGFHMGERVGRYEIECLLGRGGMAAVYRAFDPAANRNVALKVLSADAPAEDVARFQREVQVQGNIQHPHIMPIFDSGTIGRSRYFAMELLQDPVSLTHLVELARSGRAAKDPLLRPAATLKGFVRSVILPVCEAIHHANVREGVIHRDLKPDNILVDRRGLRPLVIDFGICSVVDRKNQRLAHLPAETPVRLEGGGMRITGTLVYMPPEQARGQVDRRGDVWAIGAVLHHILTGRPPLEPVATGGVRLTDRIEGLKLLVEQAERHGDDEEVALFRDRIDGLQNGRERTLEDLQREVLEGRYLPLPAHVARPLRAIVRRAMAPSPERRYRHALELRGDLERWLAERPAKAVVRRMNPARRAAYGTTLFLRRNPRGVGLAALGLVLAAWGVTALLPAARRDRRRGVERARSMEASGADPHEIEVLVRHSLGAEESAREALGLLDRARASQRLEDALERGEDLAAIIDEAWQTGDADRAADAGGRLRELVQGLVRPAYAAGGRAGADTDRIARLVAVAAPRRPLVIAGVPGEVRLRAWPVTVRGVAWAEGGAVAADEGLSPGRWILSVAREAGEVLLPVSIVPGPEPLAVACPVDPAAIPEGKVFVPGTDIVTAFGRDTVPPLLWDRVEVSVERYAAFLRGLPVAEQRTRVPRTGATSDEPGEPLWSLGPDGYDPPAASRNLPVEGISFADAEAFATARGERLPTAAEWTWAATAGLGIATPAGALDLLLRQGARVETPDRGPAPVGATPFDRTPFGVLDLSGNVAEITGTMRSWEGRQGWIVLGGAYCLGVSRALIGHAEARPGWQVSAGVGFRLVRPATALGR